MTVTIAASATTAWAQVKLPELPELPRLSLEAQIDLGLLDTGAAFSLEVGGSDLLKLSAEAAGISAALTAGQSVTLDLELPSGFALAGVVCPEALGVATNGSGVSLTPAAPIVSGLAACTFSIVDVAGTTAAAVVPFTARQADFLLSVELGLDQQMDRVSDAGGGAFQTSALAAPTPTDRPALAWDSGTRMGLTTSGETTGAIAFSASLQQAQRAAAKYAAPQKLGATGARPVVPAPQRAFNVWAEGFWQVFDSDDRAGESDGHSGVLYAGADYLLSPGFLLGALVQYDDVDSRYDSLPLEIDKTGWMVGPYAVVRLTDTLFFQGRAAWGQADSNIALDQVFDDSFASDRWLVKGRLMANLRSGPWLLRPNASIAYVEEHLDAYRSSSGVDIGARTVSLGQAKFGPEFSYSYDAGGGVTVVPALTVEGIWNFHQDLGGPNFDDLVSGTDVRGRVEAGVTIVDAGAMSVGASAVVDGIGDDDYQAIGGRARVSVPLN
ncbi:MAG: autotransporter outer membrane beta-barrel domain-containing protein [Hyphomicrobium sp.]|uniref:autotransporter outer membrane beta-barrel domain-containing protein n=1 Tax=Hyphomicrobium sp. TaxID=82 RepID=UPI003D0B53AD